MAGESFANLLGVVAVAFVAPLLLSLIPRVRVPAVVVELVLGIAVGPAVLGWIRPDEVVTVLATIGLSFLLFLAGLELEYDAVRGEVARLASIGFLASFAIALAAAGALSAAGLVSAPLFVAIVLSATGIGVILPVLKDAGESSTGFGLLVLANASIAEFATIVLLAVFFSESRMGAGGQVVSLLAFAVAAVVAVAGLARVQRVVGYAAVLGRLQDTTAQIRVRGAILLLLAAVVFAQRLGFEAILGAFLAGAILSAVDQGWMQTHEHFRIKLEAIGFGLFIPVFFVASGLGFDLAALVASPSAIARVPVFLAAMLAVRGVPALLYRSRLNARSTGAAALLQGTSLSFILAATQVGRSLGVVRSDVAAALVAAGLLSVLVFPAGALALLRGAARPASELESPQRS